MVKEMAGFLSFWSKTQSTAFSSGDKGQYCISTDVQCLADMLSRVLNIDMKNQTLPCVLDNCFNDLSTAFCQQCPWLLSSDCSAGLQDSKMHLFALVI